MYKFFNYGEYDFWSRKAFGPKILLPSSISVIYFLLNINEFFSINENGTNSITSTPLLDIISRFPLLAGRIFYKLMTVDTKNGEIDDNISFEEFDVAIINQARDPRKILDKAKLSKQYRLRLMT